MNQQTNIKKQTEIDNKASPNPGNQKRRSFSFRFFQRITVSLLIAASFLGRVSAQEQTIPIVIDLKSDQTEELQLYSVASEEDPDGFLSAQEQPEGSAERKYIEILCSHTEESQAVIIRQTDPDGKMRLSLPEGLYLLKQGKPRQIRIGSALIRVTEKGSGEDGVVRIYPKWTELEEEPKDPSFRPSQETGDRSGSIGTWVLAGGGSGTLLCLLMRKKQKSDP